MNSIYTIKIPSWLKVEFSEYDCTLAVFYSFNFGSHLVLYFFPKGDIMLPYLTVTCPVCCVRERNLSRA